VPRVHWGGGDTSPLPCQGGFSVVAGGTSPPTLGAMERRGMEEGKEEEE